VKLQALIVDDEELARSLLREQLAGLSDIEVVGEAANGFDAVKLFAERQPNLLFLDIQMPKLTGFEVLELLDRRDFAVVFITAFDEHALRAFEVNAVDYLLKPFALERLAEAVERARRRLANHEVVPIAAIAAAARPKGRPLERLLVREEGQIVVLPVNSVDYVEARDDYVVFRCGSRKHKKQLTLTEVEAQVDPACFVRVHRSFLLNLARLERLDPYAKESFVAVLTDGTRLPVSRSGRRRLETVLGGLSQ
jgi:two-component system LytT family response regulator